MKKAIRWAVRFIYRQRLCLSACMQYTVCQDGQALGTKEADEPMDFITALVRLQGNGGVAWLKMLDYGILPEELNNLQGMQRDDGGLFDCSRAPLSLEDCMADFRNACL